MPRALQLPEGELISEQVGYLTSDAAGFLIVLRRFLPASDYSGVIRRY
jgi:hypothetical protein